MKKKIQLNLGCGILLVKDFINVDKFYTLKQIREKKGIFKGAIIEPGAKYVQGDICKLPFKDNYADYIETIDTIEHISFRKITQAFSEIYRVLKPGGKLVLVTTNFDHLAQLWTERITGKPVSDEKVMESYLDLMQVIYGNQAYTGEFHTIPMNPYFIGYLMQKAGFKIKNIKMTIHPMGTRGPDRILKTSRWIPGGACVMRTDMILVQAKK